MDKWDKFLKEHRKAVDKKPARRSKRGRGVRHLSGSNDNQQVRQVETSKQLKAQP